MKIILASASPRRSELLRSLGITDFEIIPARDEAPADPDLTPGENVAAIALSKARSVATASPEDALVIAADTLVYLNGASMGKPSGEAEAAEMLRSLSGNTHSVFSGVALMYNGRALSAFEETRVTFRDLSESEISWYISTGEPLDKAGAYGAQGLGSVFVESIKGDFFNVMGLPVCRLVLMLRELGIELCDIADI